MNSKGQSLIEIVIAIFLLLVVLIPSFKTISSIRTYGKYIKDVYLIQRLASTKLDEIVNRMRNDADYFESYSGGEGNFGSYGYDSVSYRITVKDVRDELKCIYVTAWFLPYPEDQDYKVETTVAQFVARR